MDEIRVQRITLQGTGCFWCEKTATRIVGGDYDVCESDDCLDYALEKKQDDLNYLARRMNQIKSQMRYEAALNK